MNKTFRFLLLPCLFALAILAAFVFTMPVHAQDELPPSDPVPVTDPALEAAPVEESQAPEVAILDGGGEPIALDSTEAAALPTEIDPWFKVGTTTYNFTVADCDPGLGVVPCAQPLQAAVDYIHNTGKIPSDGFIHLDEGTIPNQKVVVDGTQTYENSIKGIVGHYSTSDYQPDAVLSFTDGTTGSYIRVINKLNGFTLRDLSIEGNTNGLGYWGVVRFDSVTGPVLLQTLMVKDHNPGAPGVNVWNTNGLVTLIRVASVGNTGSGAYINNTAGTAGVTITNSVFDNNLGSPGGYPATGLHILTKGAVTLSGVSASDNAGGSYASMWIDNTAGSAGVTISQSIFYGNISTGLYVRTKGAILMTNVEASQNLGVGAYGADLDNTGGVYGVTITNARFENNYTTGLKVHTKGSILLTNVASWDNDSTGGSSGAELNNTFGTTGNVTITNLASTDAAMQPGFNWNHDQGVDIFTNGYITLTNVNAIYNQEDGIRVLQATNKGATLTNCRADNNDWGAGATFAGIHINSLGSIVINGGHANGNFVAYGVSAHNETVPNASPKPVTISNFTANDNSVYGISVESKGAIKLTSVTVDYTTGGTSCAIYLDNTFSASLTPPGITLSKVTAYDNDYDGIVLYTRGTLSLTGITADANGNYGAYIAQSSTPPAYPTTTITTGSFSGNGIWGLVIYGRGAITLKDINANDNVAGNGAYIHNVSGNVSVLASTYGSNSFSYNHGTHDGLDIDTLGAVTLNKVTASGNTGANGVLVCGLVANVCTNPVGNVIINGGTFSYQAQGLVVLSKGTISVSNVVAEGNTNDGITLNNTGDITGAKGITITKAAVNYNGTGLDADSYGLITVNKIDAFGNTYNGVELYNNYAATIYPNKGVTILSSSGINNLSSNGYSGLFIRSRGLITLTGVIADSNGYGAGFDAWGIDLDESGVTGGGKKITLTNVTARYNTYSGITVDTVGGFAGSYITSNLNGLPTFWNGMSIYPHNSAVTISNSFFMENEFYGFKVIYTPLSTAALTLTNVVAVGNGFQNILVMR